MFYVSKPLGAVFAYDGAKFELVGMAIDADGVITITSGADDLASSKAEYAPYNLMTSDEVIAKFAITPSTPMLPKMLAVDVPTSEVAVALDTATDVVIDVKTLTGATKRVTVASSDTNKCTVAFNTDTVIVTPVAEGSAVITVTVEDSGTTYADAVFLMPVVVAKRPLTFVQLPDVLTTAGHAQIDIELETVAYANALTSVEVYSTDDEIVEVTYADDGTNAIVGTISLTPHATQLGEVTVFVRGVDSKSSTAETVMSFKVRVASV